MPMKQQFSENRLHISGQYKIGATLCAPSAASGQKYPAVLFIAGSGRVDRDVNIPQLKTDIFKQLADFFSQNGIISLRYDKRGCGESEGDYNAAGISDYIEDATAALRYLKSLEFVDSNKIMILGHSEGAFIAPAVYAKEPVNGLILLCGGADPGRILLPVQPQKLADEIRLKKGLKGTILRLLCLDKFILWQFKRTLNRTLSSNEDIIKIFGLVKFNAKWLREFYHFNISDYLADIDCPTLVIGGEKDIQSNPKDAARIAKAIDKSDAIIIENMNHLLREFKGVPTFLDCLKQYKQSVKQPLSQALLDELRNWFRLISV